MKKRCVTLVVLALAILSLLVACGPAVSSTSVSSSEPSKETDGRITIEGVRVSSDQVVVRGSSTLLDGTCLATQLWANSVQQAWWPVNICAQVEEGMWELVVPLTEQQALETGVEYTVRAYAADDPDHIVTLPFDLDGPPNPPSQ